jgi:hypothetical protein
MRLAEQPVRKITDVSEDDDAQPAAIFSPSHILKIDSQDV